MTTATLSPSAHAQGPATAADFWNLDPEYRDLLLNLINIHVVSELYGGDCFERSILRAPTPELKMRMAKTVMEEYGHHVRYRKLMDELGLDWEEYARSKGHLSTFDTPMESWADQAVFLALVDRAAAHQFRHFVQSGYEPFRQAAQDTLKEEYGHVGLGMDAVKQLLETPEGRAEVEKATTKWLQVGLQSFGSDNSRKNERYRHFGIKQDTNENMRAAYWQQVRAFITEDWGIALPEDFREIWSPSATDDTERAY
ncbi:Phenylacetic acid catabolic protein [Lacisediminimonas profundi]|uniref:Phenylacetic acid catabolic protein n=1 Tax=Lacisediminimonas profundi TaxID=2603856 RepID=UPI00124B563F|nr:Phenylacetic acid catabolic protein [Lacisediminimonas profundi]